MKRVTLFCVLMGSTLVLLGVLHAAEPDVARRPLQRVQPLLPTTLVCRIVRFRRRISSSAAVQGDRPSASGSNCRELQNHADSRRGFRPRRSWLRDHRVAIGLTKRPRKIDQTGVRSAPLGATSGAATLSPVSRSGSWAIHTSLRS